MEGPQTTRTITRLFRVAAASIIIAGLLAAVPRTSSAAQKPTITIDSVLRALQAGDSAIGLATLDPARHQALDSLATLLHELRASDLTIDDFVAAASADPPGFLTIFRWNRSRAARATQPALRAALLRLQQIVMPPPNGLGPRILARMQRPGYEQYVGAMELLQTRAIASVQAASTLALRRYEIKFGPSAPLLNPVETAINYAFERIPGIGFAPSAAGPGPLEIMATYSNTDITPNAGITDPKVVSSANVGLRVYTLDTTTSTSTLGRVLHPGTVSFGALALSPADRPLSSPLQSGRRWGAFFDWGQLRVAASFGQNWRALLGSSAQLIPHLF
jgi:hypothetical protein